MNNDDYESLKLTKEEIDSIKDYTGYSHTNTNSFLDIDPELITLLRSKGWLINLDKESFTKAIKDIQNIYSAMYKNSLKHRAPDKIYRGTSKKEMDKLGDEYSRILSTSCDKTIAMSFTTADYTDPAFLTITSDENVPYIDPTPFLSENQQDEQEIIFAPYTKVKKEYINDYDGISRYSLNLSKPQYELLSEEREQEYKKFLDKQIPNLDNIIAELESIDSNLSSITHKMNEYKKGYKPTDKIATDELKFLQNKLEEEQNKYYDKKGEIEKISNATKLLVQSKLRQIELNIDKEYNLEKSQRQEEHRLSEIDRLKQCKSNLITKLDDTKKLTTDVSDLLYGDDEELSSLENFAKNNGIAFKDDSKTKNDIQTKIDELNTHIDEFRSYVEDFDIPENSSIDDIKNINNDINKYYDKRQLVNSILKDVQNSIEGYKQDRISDLQLKVSMKIKDNITQDIFSKIDKEIEELSSRKDSLLDKLTGKSKVRAAKIRNCEIRKEMIRKKGLNVPDDYNTTTKYLKDYQELTNDNTQISEDNSIVKNPKYMKAYFPDKLPIVADKKLSNRQLAKQLEQENLALESSFSDTTPDTKFENAEQTITDNNKNSLETVLNYLDAANSYCSPNDLTEEQEKEIKEKQPTFGISIC